MPSRTFHSDPIGDVWYDSAGAGGVASYGILRTRVVIPATRGLCPRLELSLAATTSSEKSRIPTVIKTRK